MNVTIENLKLVMWSKKEMKERAKNSASGEWEDTGKLVEKTEYILRDEFGDVLKFISDNEYRQFEGSTVSLNLEIEYNEWQNKNTVKLTNMEQIEG